ncbi:MAG: AbrB/MazE/SpoVT family DNA-binding domain-containing protein [Cyclobacteriaceae bacterium]|nr:AbrB/MazE/SpoVT family DNA-binding domain-containing protein [Cyclobacteriaceae bacterium]
MQVSIIKIGNSKGIRLSKIIMEKYQLGEKVELILEKNQIVIKPVKKPRVGWEEAFIQMAKKGDDNLLIDDVFEDESPEEWK